MNEAKSKLVERETDKTISDVYIGYLVGKIREVIDATMTDKVQREALSRVMCDQIYRWWELANDPDRVTKM